jgi:hypothetical protein
MINLLNEIGTDEIWLLTLQGLEMLTIIFYHLIN